MKNRLKIECRFMESSTLLAIPDPPFIQPGDRILTCKGIWYGQGYYPPYDCKDCPIRAPSKKTRKMFSLIKKHIRKRIDFLRKEQEGMRKNLELYLPESFGYARLDLGIKLWELKITIWEIFI